MGEFFALIAIKFASLIFRALPLHAALALGRVLGFVALPFVSRRKVAYANLRAVFGSRYSPKERKQIVRRNLIHLCENFVEMLRFQVIGKAYYDRYISIPNLDRFQALRGKEKGAFLVTPHFGNWEMTQIVSSILGEPLHVVAKKQKHSKLDDYLTQMRSSHGSVIVHKGGAVREVVRILKEGGLVGALGDLSGGKDGMRIRFFGRKTTAPSGMYAIAREEQVALLPVFSIREKGPYHHLALEPAFFVQKTENQAKDIEGAMQRYFNLLEGYIVKHPEQWFWFYKRWKYSFTKHILFLSDDKRGHTAQTEAVEAEFKHLSQMLGDQYELSFEHISIEFISKWHHRFFRIFSWFFLPLTQGRLGVLKFFLKKTSADKLQTVHADLIVSTGAGLVPLNLILKREMMAKSVVVMSPPFPYGFRSFDLAIVPAHDHVKRHERIIETLIAPGVFNSSEFQKYGAHLAKLAAISGEPRKRMGIFIGGRTKAYEINLDELRYWLRELKLCAKTLDYDLLVTTSRRTEQKIAEVLKEELGNFSPCKLMVIANEENIENAVPGILALSEVAIVTEDSISMISDAVRAGKQVIVMSVGNEKLSKKHKRFHTMLLRRSLITVSNTTSFRRDIENLNIGEANDLNRDETEQIHNGLLKVL
jgi:Kdo2-lipid IVA lauroyltransferase/acyltransferase